MKGKLFRMSLLALIAVLILVVPASAAGKASKLTFAYSGNYICDATSCGTYTATNIPNVNRAEWIGLTMHIVWDGNDSDGTCLYGSNPDDPTNPCAWGNPGVTTLTGYIPNSMAGWVLTNTCATVTPEITYIKAGSVIKQYTGQTITVCYTPVS